MNLEMLTHLCHKIFIANPDGKALLELMERMHLETPVFPAPAGKIQEHGGATGWAAFRAGQLDMVLKLKILAHDYEAKAEAESKIKPIK